MNDRLKATPELMELLNRADALSNAIACRLEHDRRDREGWQLEIDILQEMADEADAELERVRSGAPAPNYGRGMDDPTGRMVDALENIAAELERLRLLKEHELGARIVANPDPWVKPDDAEE